VLTSLFQLLIILRRKTEGCLSIETDNHSPLAESDKRGTTIEEKDRPSRESPYLSRPRVITELL
jgi:hypothetical protein